MDIYREDATVAKIKEIVSLARPEDKLEALYLCGASGSADAALSLSILFAYTKSNTTGCFYAEDGTPLMAYGFIPQTARRSLVWAVATEHVDDSKYRRAFLEQSKIIVSDTMRGMPTVGNVVWAGNKKAIRWLKWLGAVFSDKVVQYSQEDFLDFYFKGGVQQCVQLQQG